MTTPDDYVTSHDNEFGATVARCEGAVKSSEFTLRHVHSPLVAMMLILRRCHDADDERRVVEERDVEH